MYIEASYKETERPDQRDFQAHIHGRCEIYRFLEGDADYYVEGRVYRLRKGDLILTRPMELHHLILRSGKRYARNVINFSVSDLDSNRVRDMFYGRPIGCLNHFPAAGFPERIWQHYFDKICNVEEQDRKKVYLAALLDELTEDYEVLKSREQFPETDRTAEIIGYIDRHLFEKLSLSVICDRFFISKTHLNKLFRENAGTTVWDYITAKRLISARERILRGERPTVASEACGFDNYVTFYKAYKNRFRVAPSEDRGTE